MEEILNQIIENRNYHMLSDEQVAVLKRLLHENKTLKNFTEAFFNEKVNEDINEEDEEIENGKK